MPMQEGKNREELLSARVSAELRSKFWATVPKGFKNKHVVTAAAKLWVELPPEVRHKLLTSSYDNVSFVEVVRQIVDERLKQALPAVSRKHPPAKEQQQSIRRSIENISYYVRFKLPSRQEEGMLKELYKLLAPAAGKRAKRRSGGSKSA